MKYEFSAVVAGLDLDDEFQNAGLECLPYDVLSSRTSGVTYVDVELEAPTAADAVLRLYNDLRSVNVSVLRINFELVNVTEIAERISASRESVRLWTTGLRRSGFPAHFAVVGDSRIWAWSEVLTWLEASSIVSAEETRGTPLPLEVVEGMNGAFAQMRSRFTDGWLQPHKAASVAAPAKVMRLTPQATWLKAVS